MANSIEEIIVLINEAKEKREKALKSHDEKISKLAQKSFDLLYAEISSVGSSHKLFLLAAVIPANCEDEDEMSFSTQYPRLKLDCPKEGQKILRFDMNHQDNTITCDLSKLSCELLKASLLPLCVNIVKAYGLPLRLKEDKNITYRKI